MRSQMLVSTSWLEQHLNDRNLVVLYIGRDRSQFEAGHIPGSRFVRLDDLVEQHKDSLNDLPPVADLQATFESLGVGDRSRVVLTGDALGLLAARVYFTLDYLGHADSVPSWTEARKDGWLSREKPRKKKHTPSARTSRHMCGRRSLSVPHGCKI